MSARIQVGRFVFQLGSPDGMRADVAEQPAAGADEFRVALDQPPPVEQAPPVDEAIDEAESVTGKVEHAVELFTAVAQGRADDKLVLKEADALLAALERLDRERRYADVLRLARTLTSL